MVYALVRDVVPGAWERADVTDCATPHTFAAFTMDARGLVGGLPQTPANANLRALASQRDRWAHALRRQRFSGSKHGRSVRYFIAPMR
jgi:hypothetical protein